MTEQSTYMPPSYTQQEIDDLASFIQARVKPLRDAADYGSEERRAFEGILWLTPYMRGIASWEIDSSKSPSTVFHCLAVIARQWDDHPDFQPSWAAGYERS